MSGITVSDNVVNVYQEMKIVTKNKFLLLKMNENKTEIVVDTLGSPEATHEDFLNALPEDDCRYAILDFDYEVDGGRRTKEVLILWRPRGVDMKTKLVFASTKNILKSCLNLGLETQATTVADLDKAELKRDLQL
eukprot:TRINITY_DN2713_c0_g2_i4.p1 TRINITY_DN2713_c0_g2~~TRINITY_DN2713_c0_g2_i4.p1  ORF type:complete len:135 (+),score=48.09 TRINITY_DN2713_c0_g2_i4:760-1164(+)